MTSPADLLRRVEAVGVHVRLEGNPPRLVVGPERLLTPALKAELMAADRQALVAVLRSRPPTGAPAEGLGPDLAAGVAALRARGWWVGLNAGGGLSAEHRAGGPGDDALWLQHWHRELAGLVGAEAVPEPRPAPESGPPRGRRVGRPQPPGDGRSRLPGIPLPNDGAPCPACGSTDRRVAPTMAGPRPFCAACNPAVVNKSGGLAE